MKIKNFRTKIFITFALLSYVTILSFFEVPCVVKKVIGFSCPGCGMTRALISAVRLDFKMAFSYHMMFWSMPLLYLCFLLDGKLFQRKLINRMFYAIMVFGFFINWLF